MVVPSLRQLTISHVVPPDPLPSCLLPPQHLHLPGDTSSMTSSSSTDLPEPVMGHPMLMEPSTPRDTDVLGGAVSRRGVMEHPSGGRDLNFIDPPSSFLHPRDAVGAPDAGQPRHDGRHLEISVFVHQACVVQLSVATGVDPVFGVKVKVGSQWEEFTDHVIEGGASCGRPCRETTKVSETALRVFLTLLGT